MHQETTKQDRAREKGNVIFIILIAIGLLAALTFSVTRSNRQSGGISQEQVNIDVGEMFQFTNVVEDASIMLMAKGCEETQLNFYTASWGGDAAEYANPNAPVDKSCNIFDVAGGGVKYQAPPPAVQSAGGTVYLITGNVGINGIGTSAYTDGLSEKDIVLMTKVSQEICIRINTKANIVNTGGVPPTYQFGALGVPATAAQKFGATNRFFDGHLIANATHTPNGAEIVGKPMGCYQSTSNSAYYFYKVLLAR